jgi:uncharacterized oxidoreductase
MVTIKPEKLIGFVADIFARVGSSKAEADRVATYLVTANLTGHDSHGVIRVPKYVGWVQDGSIIPDQTIKLEVDTPSLAVIDGGFGFGQTVTPQAVRVGIDKCKANGLAAITLKNSGHLGRVGDWAEMAAAEGLISIFFVNAAGSVLVAPFGGVARKLSTAPYCVGIPRPGQRPVVLDFATSLVAEGKVMVASRGGKALPRGALISEDGNLTEDPHELYGPYEPTGPRDHAKGTGAIRAFGEHKGSGLALMCELLGGALTGNGATSTGRRFANGMLGIFIDPKAVDPAHFFDGEVARYIAYFKDSKLAHGHDAVLIPGEPEAASRAARTANGVPLTDDTWASIVAAGRALGIDEAAVKAAEA